jgi:hypothetical protein
VHGGGVVRGLEGARVDPVDPLVKQRLELRAQLEVGKLEGRGGGVWEFGWLKGRQRGM